MALDYKSSAFKGRRRRERRLRKGKKLRGRAARIHEQEQAKAQFDERMAAYEQMEFTNPYENMENVYEGMENKFEDLRIDTTAQELSASQYAQNVANMSGAMDPSNVGQFLRSAGQQAAQARATTAQQEIANQRMAAQGASQVQSQVLAGRESVQASKMAGAQWVQQQEIAKQQELLAMAAGRKQAADQARQANTQAWMSGIGGALTAGVELMKSKDD